MKAVLILASNSPRRRELIRFGGWEFDVRPVDIDETPYPDEDALAYVRRMAYTKATHAAAALEPGRIAVTADTTVVDGEEILGKPSDHQEAVAMLRRLRGRSHQVHTAIGVFQQGNSRPHIEVCTTNVPMRYYSDEEILTYVASGDPFDKAGGYAIQHAGFRPVDHLNGCYANVVGLPVCHLVRALRAYDIDSKEDVHSQCLSRLGFSCRVYPKILEKGA